MKKNWTTLSKLSKEIKTHSKYQLKKIANILDETISFPPHRKEMGISEGIHIIYSNNNKVEDYAFHDTFITHIKNVALGKKTSSKNKCNWFHTYDDYMDDQERLCANCGQGESKH
tara:strand:+ start:2510 stop:2854 length:345 start_codon:yes stop_codon:yes gene_type:complete